MANFPVLIKVDDISLNSNLQHWSKFTDVIIKAKARADIGFISVRNDEAIKEFESWYEKLNPNVFTFWNHGAYHKKEEFTSDKKTAENSFSISRDIETKIFGAPLKGFGAPYNAINSGAVNTWKENSPAGYIYYPDICGYDISDNGYKYIPYRFHCSFERASHGMNPVYKYFRGTYKEIIDKKQPMVLQIHPARWNDQGFIEFYEILQYLRRLGATFCSPSNFLELLDFEIVNELKNQKTIPLVHANLMAKSKLCADSCLSEIYSVTTMLQEIWDVNVPDFTITKKRTTDPALLFLDDFPSYLDYDSFVKKSQKGTRIRLIKKARKLGYTCSFFSKSLYIPDIVEVNTSLEVRAAGKMPVNYQKSVDELGGYPKKYIPFDMPVCPNHYDIWIGVFKPEEGYTQGSVVTNQKLVGYIHFRRLGEVAAYSLILGHGSYMNDGVVNLLHHHAMEWLLERKDAHVIGLKYLMYGGINHGGKGREDWKRREGFKHAILQVYCNNLLHKEDNFVKKEDVETKNLEETTEFESINHSVDLCLHKFDDILNTGVPDIFQIWNRANKHYSNNEVVEAKKCERLIYFLHNSIVYADCKLGKNVHFAYGGIGVVIHQKAEISDGVLIGQNVTIGVTPGKFRLAGDKRLYVPKISEHCYVAAGVRILGGIEIGSYSVIGANSVVTKDIPPLSVVAGSPAKVINTINSDNCLKYKGLFKFAEELSNDEFSSFIKKIEAYD